MAPEQWEQIKQQFEAIVHLDAEARAQVFAQLQSKDPKLCAQVQELVANDEEAGDFLTQTLIVKHAPRFNAGETLAARYRIERFIGRGGMGEVYEAYDNELGERVALKTIVPDAALDERYVVRLLREARLARRIANRHVCRVHDIGHHQAPWGRICFYTMELLEGETLADRLSNGRSMSAREALPLIEQLAEALQAAHDQNIIHRDFKPGNIMLVPEGATIRVVVTDFGLARSADVPPLYTTRQGSTPPGTLGYIAPELFRPGAVATVASDIYSFGVVIQEMVTGRRSERDGCAPALLAPIDPRWQHAIRRCLENDPDRRFKTAEDVVYALRPQTLPARSIDWGRKHPSLAAAGIVFLTALIPTPLLMNSFVKPQLTTEYRQITDDSGLSKSPAISHDGKLLVYASDRDGTGNLNLYLRQVDGEVRPMRLTHEEADDYGPSFSADDTRIVFRSDRNGGGVYQIPTFGGTPQLVAHGGFGPAFSPDGQWIAYWLGLPGSGFIPGSSQVYVKPASGGPAKRLETNLVASYWPIWAPDSKRLLVVGKPDTSVESAVSVDWWCVSVEGGPAVKSYALAKFRSQKLTPPLDYDWITPIAWLSSPNRILFSATQGDTTNLWEVPISDTGKVTGPAIRRTFTTSLDLDASTIAKGSGTSTRMFFASLTGSVNVWSLPLDGNSGRGVGAMLNLTTGIPYSAVPSVSAGGTELAFIAAQSKVWSVRARDLETGQEISLTAKDLKTTPGARWLRPRISPDGTTIAYVDNTDQMFLADRLTGTTEVICKRCGPPTDISGDNRKVLFEPLNPPEDVMMIDVPARKIGSIVHADRPDHILYSGRLSPDGQWVAFEAALDSSANKTLFISPIRNGKGLKEAEWIPVTDGSHVDVNAVWSPDGNFLYFLSERDGFRCIWAQHLRSSSKRPDGAPFPVRHFHSARQSLARFDRFDLIGLSAARDKLVFSVSELTGNIWMEERKSAR